MSDFQTRSTLDTAGGGDDDTMPRPTLPLGFPLQDGTMDMGREAQVDSRRQGEVEVGSEDDRDLDDRGWLINAGVSTIGNEKRSQGWEKNTVPSGAPPHPNSTVGSRGAADIGKM